MRKNKFGLGLLGAVIGIGGGCSQANRQLIYSGEIELSPGNVVNVDYLRVPKSWIEKEKRIIKKRDIELIGTEDGELREIIVANRKIYDSSREEMGFMDKANYAVPFIFLPANGIRQVIGAFLGERLLSYSGQNGVLSWQEKYRKHLNAADNAVYWNGLSKEERGN
jgi:hypothetical protein